jgi:two-component system chemotaxis response regulator CheB
MKQLRCLVLDDSAICRARLRDILESEGDIKVVAEAENGKHVLELIAKNSPDILLVDLQMPGMDGHATIEQVMAHHPLPILVVTGQPHGARRDVVFESIRRGALDLAEKPARADSRAQARLRHMVRTLATLPVVRHVAGKLGSVARDFMLPTAVAAQGQARSVVLGIGASAGGPGPLATLLSDIPAGFPGAIAVVQHLPPGFTEAFAEFLRGRTTLRVRVPEGRVRIEHGSVYLAPDHRHLIAHDTLHFDVSAAPAVEGHRPAATVLLQSLATVFGSQAAGVILSGMGRDGVAGLLQMRAKGGLTLAQDRESSAVYGMPRAALESGAAQYASDPLSLARTVRSWAQDFTSRRGAP